VAVRRKSRAGIVEKEMEGRAREEREKELEKKEKKKREEGGAGYQAIFTVAT
jgi:hypothetical protein